MHKFESILMIPILLNTLCLYDYFAFSSREHIAMYKKVPLFTNTIIKLRHQAVQIFCLILILNKICDVEEIIPNHHKYVIIYYINSYERNLNYWITAYISL